jgi:hypothetical protein
MSKSTKGTITNLDQDSILTAEYTYIAQTTFQANEDRARVTNFYLVTLGSGLVGILSRSFWNTTPASTNSVSIGLGILFLLLAFQGIMTVFQLARLRGAWFESVKAMNQIKSYYEHQFPDLEKAFRWGKKNLPKRFKPNSIGFYFAIQVSFLSGVFLAAAISVFIPTTIALETKILIGIVIFIVTNVLLMLMFKYIMEKK